MTKNLKKGKIVACLDMGSSKVVCLIASIDNGEVRNAKGSSYNEKNK
jgi:cell division ATPase FtsA